MKINRPLWRDRSRTADVRTADLLRRMTLEEKVAQMGMIDVRKLIRNGQLVESLIPEPSLIISPNPASSVITIKTPVRGQLTILAINGQKLLQQQITRPFTMIDISKLEEGMYLVELVSEKEVQVGKLFKK